MSDVLEKVEEHDRFFLKASFGMEEQGWTEVTKEEFIRAESAAGFHSKFGPGHVATAGFGQTKGESRIQGRTISTKYNSPEQFSWDPEFRKVAFPDG